MPEISEARRLLAGAGPSIGAWSTLVEPRVAHALASGGFDWVCVDQQHGYSAGADASASLAAITAAGVPALVRVSWNRPEEIGRVLDAGADGVVVPMVETAAEAAEAVASARYAPDGRRSWAPARGPHASRLDDPGEANAATACFVMVETPGAVGRVEEIAAVPGLDGVFVGPFDLSLAYGTPVDTLLADTSDGAPLSRVVAACRDRGVTAGAYAGTVERAATLRSWGFTMLAVTSDDALITRAAADAATEARRVIGPR